MTSKLACSSGLPKFANFLSLLEIGEDVISARANMRANEFHGVLSTALLHGLQKLQVLLMGCDPSGGIIEAVGSSLQNDALKNLRERLGQRFIAGEPGNLEMNVLIVNQPVASKSFSDILAVKIYLHRQLGECRLSKIFYSLFYREGFQGFAQLIELGRLLQSNFFTGKTPVRQEGDVSLLHQTGQRFTHGSSTHTEALT